MRKVCHSQTFVINTECFLSISQVNTVVVFHGCFTYYNLSHGYLSTYQGRIQDFKLGGGRT